MPVKSRDFTPPPSPASSFSNLEDYLMRTSAKIFCFLAMLAVLLWPGFVMAQGGTIVGTAKDADGDILPSAAITVTPGDLSIRTNPQGEFVITNLTPGKYSLSVSYLGFTTKNIDVNVSAGQVTTANVTLDVATQNDTVVVTSGRSYGEAEAVNETRASDTIVNILPAAVISSLPNANIADAVGRLPGVTLERDEGEGKYVQIRGTEPRLSNLTVDGVVVPSPEGTVRQVKLDTIPAGLIDAVEINKTLLPNMDGDAIGGSVNLITKIAGERPTVSLYGAGGFTPIIKTVGVYEFGGTVGQRFGEAKRIGVILSGSYDYNGRGIDDFEATQNAFFGTLTPYYDSGVFRQYKYDRTRYGFGGSVDYKLNDTSLIYVRGIFSDFADKGHRWEYIVNTNPDLTMNNSLPSITTERRIGDFQVANVVLGGNHVFTKSWFNWGLAVGRSRMQNPLNGGEAITDFVPVSIFTNSNCQYDPTATKNKYKPQFTPACFTEAYNPDNFQLNTVSQSGHGMAAQLNLTAFASYARNFQIGSHPSTFEFGFKVRNAHKFDDSYTNDYQHNANLPGSTTPPVLESSLLGGFNNPNYYGGAWKFAPNSPSWEMANAYLAAHPNEFTLTSTKGGSGANFDLVERVTAGYFMDTVDFGRFRVIGGLRIEGTDDRTLSFDGSPKGTGLLTVKGGGTYVSLLPSASVRFRLDNSSDLRFVYGRALNRPDPQFLTQSFIIDCGTSPCTVTLGNNTLRPEHANNYDLLYERYLTPFGLLQAGFFYKSLSDPVVTVQTPTTGAPCPTQTPTFPACFINTPVNAGTAYISGFELAFLYHFTRLPGLLSGLGVSANYSYAASQAHNVNPGNRTDSPALLRQAPNTWNISPTYDHGRLSVRLGLAYNGSNIFVYNYSTSNTCGLSTAPAGTAFDPVAGSIKGPCGDQYLYSHFQVDLQGSFRIRRGLDFTASALNLNNEVFGFYYGSPQFVNQREYYKPTYSFGFRWDPFAGRR
jgi:TonB-dependent receptor